MIKSKILAMVIFVVVFLLVGNLLDWAFVTFITKGKYTFSALYDAAIPVIIALTCGYFFITRNEEK